ncbi:MAG TPA: MarR family transcriptional regulator [Chthonomonadaceae bacterium]|nr:MarR family transcriptional regulator [Chthonomonadaceae bacterium]
MSRSLLPEQAFELESLLSTLHRRLFTLDADHLTQALPLAQLRVCLVLEEGPKTLSGLASALQVSMSAATQIATRLERIGLVCRKEIPEDRRSRLFLLTDEGAALMRSRRDIRLQRVALALNRLPPEARASVLSMLHILLEAADLSREAGAPSGEAVACADQRAVLEVLGSGCKVRVSDVH